MIIQRSDYKTSTVEMFIHKFGPLHHFLYKILYQAFKLDIKKFKCVALSGGLMRCFSLIIPQDQYAVIFTFMAISILLSGIMIFLPYIFSKQNFRDSEKTSEYECGFEPFDSATRQPFTVHFYIVGILFLIFDVEMALLFPWSVILQNGSWYSY